MRPFPFTSGPIFALIFWAVFASWILPEVNAWRARRSSDSSQARDQGSLNLIVILWWLGIALGFLFSIYLPEAAIAWKRTTVFFLGIGLILLGIALRWSAAAVLGKYFTFDVSIAHGQNLVERGPYRYIRHPSYSGALLSLLGFGLALGNWAASLAALACLCIAYAYRIPVEERALASSLGDSYRRYMRRTWRLVPFVF